MKKYFLLLVSVGMLADLSAQCSPNSINPGAISYEVAEDCTNITVSSEDDGNAPGQGEMYVFYVEHSNDFGQTYSYLVDSVGTETGFIIDGSNSFGPGVYHITRCIYSDNCEIQDPASCVEIECVMTPCQLPVEWVSASARQYETSMVQIEGKGVCLNVGQVRLQHKYGQEWVTFNRWQPVENNGQLQTFAAIHTNPHRGAHNLYRYEVVDFDGTITYSEIMACYVDGGVVPFTKKGNDYSMEADWELYDSTGRLRAGGEVGSTCYIGEDGVFFFFFPKSGNSVKISHLLAK